MSRKTAMRFRYYIIFRLKNIFKKKSFYEATKMKLLRDISVWTTLVVLGISSCSKVIVPPAIDLKQHQAIGIIKFNCSEPGNLDAFVTQKFIQEITKDQKSIEIIELGTQTDVLNAVGQSAIGPDAYKAMGIKYNVKSIILGDIEISDIKPEISIAPGFSYVEAQGIIEASLIVRMVETSNGATIWSGTTRDKREVGSIGIIGGKFMFDAEDPEHSYGSLVDALVKRVTKDFKNTWYWKRKCL
ncbi:MAG: hypothetical protein N2201_02415 [candidate division WOR-3 bacterium]|nr:hypothetical protein [candidate division WOR-3 bacterium]